MTAIRLLFLALFSLPAAALPRPVPLVDLQRYSGQWFEVARIPNTFQKACAADVRAEYRPVGKSILITNSCRRANGEPFTLNARAELQDASGARWLVRPESRWLSWVPMLNADYRVVDLAEDYSHAAVSMAGTDYLWILSRQPRLDEDVYRQILQRMARQGFPVDKLQRTPAGGERETGRT